MNHHNRILIVATNVGEYEKVGYRTGLWLGELTHFYDVAEKAGFALDIASPAGGYVPIDPESLMPPVLAQGGTERRYTDRTFMDQLVDTRSLKDVRADDYDAIYLTGGHGVSFDFPKSAELAALIARMYEEGKVVSAVCHGPAGLLEVQLSNGEPFVKGRKLTAFSWKEEVKSQREDAVPFNLEEALRERGADYDKALFALASHVVVDGRLITGQNPASAEGVGKAVVKALQAQAD